MALQLHSDAFSSGSDLPVKYTCEGENVSPALSWSGVPQDAASLVLICDAPEGPNQPFTHWVLYNIPPQTTHLPEKVLPTATLSGGAMQGRNTYGRVQYEGPCPQPGPANRFYFRLYALDDMLELSPGASREQVMSALNGHLIEETNLMCRYAGKVGGGSQGGSSG